MALWRGAPFNPATHSIGRNRAFGFMLSRRGVARQGLNNASAFPGDGRCLRRCSPMVAEAEGWVG